MTAEQASVDASRRAWSLAAEAMAAAGVEIRPVASPQQAQIVREILDSVFRFAPGESEASVDLLCAMAHTGQYIVLAHDVTAAGQPPIASSFGFFCPPPFHTLHSHATAVMTAGRGRHLGRAVKIHQRAWALERGVDTITWTFDPLVRRNAWFNLVRLGARALSLEPDYYGPIPDLVNGGDESDRFLVRWDLQDRRVHAACAGQAQELPVAELLAGGAPQILSVGPGDEPAPAARPGTARTVLAQVPPDIEAIRAVDPQLSRRWRYCLRGVLGEAFDNGFEIMGVSRDGWYVLERPDADVSQAVP